MPALTRSRLPRALASLAALALLALSGCVAYPYGGYYGGPAYGYAPSSYYAPAPAVVVSGGGFYGRGWGGGYGGYGYGRHERY